MSIEDTIVNEYNNNPDLKWDIDDIGNKKDAFYFCKNFENFIPVYSPTAENIYTKYQFLYNGEEDMITILPDMSMGLTHIINNVSPNCIDETHYSIIPGAVMNQSGAISFNHKTRTSKDLKTGLLDMAKEDAKSNNIFCPILTRGSLHSFGEGDSYQLRIYKMDFEQLHENPRFSSFDVNNIRNHLVDKFIKFYKQSQRINNYL